MFSTILEEADEETASRMVPVILERVGLLYHVKNYRKEIHEWVFFVLWAISNIVRQYSEVFFLALSPAIFLENGSPLIQSHAKLKRFVFFSLLFSRALGSWHVIFSFVMIELGPTLAAFYDTNQKLILYRKYLHSLCQITVCFWLGFKAMWRHSGTSKEGWTQSCDKTFLSAGQSRPLML